jgi:hypothetical protein
VYVNEQTQGALTFEARNHLFEVIDGGVEGGRGFQVTPIQVVPGKAAAVVAIDDAIRVQHWHNLEDKVGTQPGRLYSIACDKAQ